MLVDSVPELQRFSRRRALGVIAGFVGGVSIFGCGPSREPQPPAPRLPSQTVEPDLVVVQPTQTPEPEPTSTPRPVEPTATPIQEVARFLQQTPVYGIYTGENITEPGGEGVVGESLFSRLPDDRVLGAITRYKLCPDGTPVTSIFLVSPNFIRGVGFGYEGAVPSLTAGLSNPEFISGVLTIKDHARPGGTCIGNKNLSIGARLLPERGKNNLLIKLTTMLQKADPRTTLAGVTSRITQFYGSELPEEPSK